MGIVNYSRNGEMIEVIVRDPDGAKIETHCCNVNDKKKYTSLVRYLRDKYGFELLLDLYGTAEDSEEKQPDEPVNWWV